MIEIIYPHNLRKVGKTFQTTEEVGVHVHFFDWYTKLSLCTKLALCTINFFIFLVLFFTWSNVYRAVKNKWESGVAAVFF